MSTLDGIEIKAHLQGAVSKMRGVLTNIPQEMTLEEVKKGIRGGKVLEARRLQSSVTCDGEHSAAYGSCMVQKQTKEVQRYRIVNKVSFAEALRSVGMNEVKQRSKEFNV